jgi:hypothetical protein
VKEIKISPAAQLVAAILIVLGFAALLAAEAPELRRYLSIRSM